MKHKIFAIGIIFAMVSPAFAAPMVHTKCSRTTPVKEVPNGAGVYLNADCTTAYVLPPAAGSATVTGLSPSEGLTLCEGFESALEGVNFALAEVKRLRLKLNPQASMRSPLDGGGPLGNGRANRGVELTEEQRSAVIAQLKEAQIMADESHKMLEPFKDIHGAEAMVTFRSDWGTVVNAYQEANPKLNFQPMPLAAQVLSFERRTVTDFKGIPAAYHVSIPGERSLPLNGDSTSEESQGNGLIFGAALSGQIRLTLAGACPFFNSATRTLPKSLSASQLTAYFSSNAQYVFNLQSKRNYSAEYNLGQMVKKIQESGSKGGFFSSSSYSKMLIDRSSTDWFKFKSEDEDPRFAYELDSLRSTVKAEMIARVANNLIEIQGGNPASVPAPGAPGPNGAKATAGVLKYCPNLYCQATGLALGVLDSIFGSSKTTSDYINQNDHWAYEAPEEIKALPFTGSQTFIGND